MDHKDALHIIATLSNIIGEQNFIAELDAIGWRGIASHPVEFFRGYFEGVVDTDDYEDRVQLVISDMSNIGLQYGLELNGDDFVDTVPR